MGRSQTLEGPESHSLPSAMPDEPLFPKRLRWEERKKEVFLLAMDLWTFER